MGMSDLTKEDIEQLYPVDMLSAGTLIRDVRAMYEKSVRENYYKGIGEFEYAG